MDERSRDGGDAGRKGVAGEDEHLVETPLWPGLEPKAPAAPTAAPNPAAAGSPAETGAPAGEAAAGEKRRRRPKADAGAGEGAAAAVNVASAGAAATGGGEGDARAPGEPAEPGAPEASLRFEEAVAALEEAVRKLEAGDLPLEEAMRLFQDGVRLSRRCAALLDEAERKMELLLAQEGEAPTLKPYDMPPGPGRGAQGA